MALVKVTRNPDGTTVFYLSDEPWTTVQAIERAASLGVPIGFEGYGIQGVIQSWSAEQQSIDVTVFGDPKKTYAALDSHAIEVVVK
jgi:hypothetical protein